MQDGESTRLDGNAKFGAVVSLSKNVLSKSSPVGQETIHREVEQCKTDRDALLADIIQARFVSTVYMPCYVELMEVDIDLTLWTPNYFLPNSCRLNF